MNLGKRLTTLVLLSIFLMQSPAIAATSYDFNFKLTDGNVKSLSDYNDKVILLEFAASWCSTCKANQQAMNAIYSSYMNNVNFLSISFGGSGDTLDDVLKMKTDGGYQWDFALDHEDKSKLFDFANGDIWIMQKDLTIYKSWDYTRISTGDLVTALDEVLALDPANSSDVTPATTRNTSPTTTQELQGTDIFSNPLFIGFISIIGIIIVFLGVNKLRT